MRTTNLTGLPEPLAAALRDDGYSRGQADISVTGLIAPPRKVALEEQHAAILEEDAADMAAVLIGKAVHAFIAAKATGELSDKKRLMMQVNGWVVSGQTDHVDSGEVIAVSGGKIVDYKSTSVNEWKYGLKEERAQQLNCYAELLRANGYTVSGLSAILIFKDWSATRQAYEKDYPPHSIMEVEVPLWPQEEAQRYILERVLLHQQARNYDVLCTDEERWLRTKYAVVKGAAKRATRLFETQEEAEQFTQTCQLCKGEGEKWDMSFDGDDPPRTKCKACGGTGRADNPDFRVEVRGGEPTRCMYFCAVGRLGLCEQYEGEK